MTIRARAPPGTGTRPAQEQRLRLWLTQDGGVHLHRLERLPLGLLSKLGDAALVVDLQACTVQCSGYVLRGMVSEDEGALCNGTCTVPNADRILSRPNIVPTQDGAALAFIKPKSEARFSSIGRQPMVMSGGGWNGWMVVLGWLLRPARRLWDVGKRCRQLLPLPPPALLLVLVLLLPASPLTCPRGAVIVHELHVVHAVAERGRVGGKSDESYLFTSS